MAYLDIINFTVSTNIHQHEERKKQFSVSKNMHKYSNNLPIIYQQYTNSIPTIYQQYTNSIRRTLICTAQPGFLSVYMLIRAESGDRVDTCRDSRQDTDTWLSPGRLSRLGRARWAHSGASLLIACQQIVC